MFSIFYIHISLFYILLTSTAVLHNEARQSLLSCRAASAANGDSAKGLKQQHVGKDGQMLRHSGGRFHEIRARKICSVSADLQLARSCKLRILSARFNPIREAVRMQSCYVHAHL